MDHLWLDIFDREELEPQREQAALAVLQKHRARPLDDGSGFRGDLKDGTAFELKCRLVSERERPFHAHLFPYGLVGRAFSDFLFEFVDAIGCVIRLDTRPPVTL